MASVQKRENNDNKIFIFLTISNMEALKLNSYELSIKFILVNESEVDVRRSVYLWYATRLTFPISRHLHVDVNVVIQGILLEV